MNSLWSVLGIFVVWIVLSPSIQADEEYTMPKDLRADVLTRSVPTPFPPIHYSYKNYRLVWVGKAISGVKASVEQDSLQWMRPSPHILIPRVRVRVEGSGSAGQVENAGFVQSMSEHNGTVTSIIPVAAFSDQRNKIKIRIQRGGQMIEGALRLQFQTLQGQENVVIDTTCSKYGVRVESGSVDPSTMLYIGCRMVLIEGSGTPRASLELVAFWDGVGQKVLVDGIETAAGSLSVWKLRLRHAPKSVRFQHKKSDIRIGYYIADRLRLGFLGAGLGPYLYTFNGGKDDVNTVVPLLTVYGSYMFTSALRIVMFDATAFHKNWFTDVGIYILLEQTRVFDNRLQLNLLLGGHALVLNSQDTVYAVPSFPQGIEVKWFDFLQKRNFDLSMGLFFYPEIEGRTYYNGWVRWGSRGYFAEFNYISFKEPINSDSVYSRSVGLTFGMPLTLLF